MTFISEDYCQLGTIGVLGVLRDFGVLRLLSSCIYKKEEPAFADSP